MSQVLNMSGQSGPPDDLVNVFQPEGWETFETDAGSKAWVMPNHGVDGVFLLHWIESRRPGDGRTLMEAITGWAVAHGFHLGSLICDDSTIMFYEKFGWRQGAEFTPGFTAMWWEPT